MHLAKQTISGLEFHRGGKVQGRENLERTALFAFENVARKHGFTVFKGQGSDNRLLLGGNLYFQFGDLRVDTDTHHIVVEAESAGGVTNLAKYWYCLADRTLSKSIVKPITLLHLFRQVSASDYGSHLALWDFLLNEMRKTVGDQIQATRYPYRDLSDLEPAIRHFEKSILLR
jgi:hypothetical protein